MHVTLHGIHKVARHALVASMLVVMLAPATAAHAYGGNPPPYATLAVAAAAGLSDLGVTVSQTSGAKLTRFTFTAKTTSPIESVTLSFPGGFAVGEAAANAVILEGLQRSPVEVTQRTEGQSLRLTFKPEIPSGSNVRVQVYDVRLPAEGGQFALDVRYVSKGTTGETKTPTFKTDTVTRPEAVAVWLDEQPWVEKWNSVAFFNYFLKPQEIAISAPLLFGGWLISIVLVAVAFPVAIIVGLALAFMKMARFWPVRWIAGAYINLIRGTPLLLQIYIAFVGLPIAGIRAPFLITGISVLALNSSAYLAEIFRAGIQSIHKGQMEAASSLGMTYPQAMAFVIIPQTVRRVLPTMTSEFILLFKDTALLSAVGVFELMLYANTRTARGVGLTPFVVAAAYYLIVTIPLINWVASLEARLALSEGGQSAEAKQKRGGVFGRMFRRSAPQRAAAEAEGS